MLTFLTLIILSVSKTSWAQALAETVGILGDNLALGAAAHPDLSLDMRQLSQITSGQVSVKPREDARLYPFRIKDDLSPPNVLWSGIRDYEGNSEWVYS